MSHALEKGATIRLPTTAVRAVVRWLPAGGESTPDIDASALLLDASGRVGSEGDFVFYNQPRHPSGLVRRLPKQRDASWLSDTLEVELARLGGRVRRVVLAASAEGGFRVAASQPRLVLLEAAGGSQLAFFPLTPAPQETALVCGELVRGGDRWEFRALGRGFGGGLVELAAEFGIAAARPAPPVADPPSPPRPEPTRRRQPAPYGYIQPDPGFTLPPQGPQFQPPRR